MMDLRTLALIALVLTLVVPRQAAAQIVSDFYPTGVPGLDDIQTIPTPPRPDFDPQGVKIGDFTAHPFVAEGLGYDSNYLGAARAAGSPTVNTSGGVDVSSDWSRNKLAATANVVNSTYLNAPQQNRTDALAGVGGNYEIGQDTLTLAGLYVFNHVVATDLDASNITQPVAYNVGYVRGAYTLRSGLLSIEPELSYAVIRYDNLVAQGQITNLAYFDRDIALAGVAARYALSNLTNAVLNVRGFNTNYQSAAPGMANESSNSFEVLGGLTAIGNAVWQYRLLGGVETRQFQNSAYRTATTPIVVASLIWSPTKLTSVTGILRRDIEDSVYTNQIGYKYSGLTLRVDHQYLPNILFSGNVGAQLANYLQSTQQDATFNAGGSVTWLMNRNMSINGSYNFNTRTSNVANHYDESVILVQLRFRL